MKYKISVYSFSNMELLLLEDEEKFLISKCIGKKPLVKSSTVNTLNTFMPL